MRSTRIAALGIVAVVALLPLARVALGMPMFARKTEMPCGSCHTVIPKLNETGMMYRASGWRAQADVGAEDKDVNNISTQTSVRLQTRYDGSQTTDKLDVKTKSSQITFHEITLYPLTGAFNKNFASLLEISLLPEAFAEIENAYIRGVWKAGEGYFSGRVGIFHPFEGFGASDRPLSISRPLFQTTAAKDATTQFPFTPWGFDESGLELGYAYGRTILTATVFNGLTYDVAKAKAFPAQGGNLTKSSSRPSFGNKDFQIFLTQILNANGGGVSVHYYNGAIDLPGAGGTFFQDKFYRAAGYASYPLVSRLHILGGYQQGDDKFKIGAVENTSTSQGFFGEADVDLRDCWVGGRFDSFDPSDDVDKDQVQAFTLAINRPFNNGLQMIGEYQHKATEQGVKPGGGDYPDKREEKFQLRGIWIW